MKFSNTMSDETILNEAGSRIARYRLNRNLTQAMLAKEAGVSLSTVNRIEAGQSSQLTNLIRLIRALGLVENMESLIPIAPASPIQQLKLQGKIRQRAYRTKTPSKNTNTEIAEPWSWNLSDNE